MDEISSEMKLGNPDAPETPYEAEMFGAMNAAIHTLEPVIAMLAARGFIDTEAKSRGFLLAVNHLLAIRLIEHCTNAELPIEAALGKEINTIVANLKQMVNDNYEEVLASVILSQAEGATKQ